MMERWAKELAISRVRSAGMVARMRAKGVDVVYDPERPTAPPVTPAPAQDTDTGPDPTDRAARALTGKMVYNETKSWRDRYKLRHGLEGGRQSQGRAPDEPTLVLGAGLCQHIRKHLGPGPADAQRTAAAQRNPDGSAAASSLDAGGTRPPHFVRDAQDPSASMPERVRRATLNKLAEPALAPQDRRPKFARSTPTSGRDLLGRDPDDIL